MKNWLLDVFPYWLIGALSAAAITLIIYGASVKPGEPRIPAKPIEPCQAVYICEKLDNKLACVRNNVKVYKF